MVNPRLSRQGDHVRKVQCDLPQKTAEIDPRMTGHHACRKYARRVL